MPFQGFGPEALPFLKALAFHQSKEWFDANKAIYESNLKTPMGDLVEDLTLAFQAAKIPLKGDRKGSLFRIYRDVRFSKDKSPYKTNVGAVMTRIGGSKNEPGLFYFHCAVEGCFTAIGFYDPQPEALARLRAAMVRAPKAWAKLLVSLSQQGLHLSDEYALKRAPKGYEDITDEPILKALRHKSLVVTHPLAPERLADPALIQDLAAFAKAALPLLSWGWDAIADTR